MSHEVKSMNFRATKGFVQRLGIGGRQIACLDSRDTRQRLFDLALFVLQVQLTGRGRIEAHDQDLQRLSAWAQREGAGHIEMPNYWSQGAEAQEILLVLAVQ
jgi:hypothetical protein